ncbi:MAG: hypothetical protein ACKOW9_03060 [Candidatus Paceibacterota bacterium]
MSKTKKLLLLLLSLSLPLLLIATQKKDINTKSLLITEINNCATESTTFLNCITPFMQEVSRSVPVDQIEVFWVNNSIKRNWPKCHEALHQIGHYLPELTPAELRKASGKSFSTLSGDCALGLMMGYAERDIQNITKEGVLSFNENYCLPEFDTGVDYSNQCSHITGHLSFFYNKKNTLSALKLCADVKYHPALCSEGVYMLHFAEETEKNPTKLSSAEALAKCNEFSVYLERCLPFASHLTNINTVMDVSKQGELCLELLRKQENSALTCLNVITQSFARLPAQEMPYSHSICLNLPFKEDCAASLLRIVARETKDINMLNTICSSPLEDTKACVNRYDYFYQVSSRPTTT